MLSEIRWDWTVTGATVLHDLIHPPFARADTAWPADQLAADSFLVPIYENQKTRAGSYPTLPLFVEENIVEAAHVYLAQQEGLIRDPLAYFRDHDGGTHVLSPSVFRALADNGPTQVVLCDLVFTLHNQGILAGGRIHAEYQRCMGPLAVTLSSD